MNRLIPLFVLSLLLWSCNNEAVVEQVCDNGTYVGNVRLLTQQEVDDFGAMCYSKIEGNLILGENWDFDNNILDLSPLSSLTEIYQGIDDPSIFGGSIQIVA